MFWKQVCEGDSQITREATRLGHRYMMGRCGFLAAEEFEPEVPAAFFASYPRDMQLYMASLVRALRHSGSSSLGFDRSRAGLFDGTSRGPFLYWEELRDGGRNASGSDLMFGIPGQAAAIGATALGVEGPVQTFNASCCSGMVAIGQACREIAEGRIDMAVAGGHEATLCDAFFASYREAGILCPSQGDPRTASRVYRDSAGVVFAEGAANVVLESRESALRRGARILGTLGGYAHGNHAQHPTHVDDSGRRATRLIEDLLREAGVSPDDVGFVIGHGNGRPASDASELAFMRQLFGGRCGEMPLVSVKPVVGHTLGASGAVNFVVSLLAARSNRVPPTLNVVRRPEDEFHFGGRELPRRHWQMGLSLSLGMGGHQAARLVQRPREAEANCQ